MISEEVKNSVNYKSLQKFLQTGDYRDLHPEEHTPITVIKVLGRNDICNCGSGLKYKRCCLNKNREG